MSFMRDDQWQSGSSSQEQQQLSLGLVGSGWTCEKGPTPQHRGTAAFPRSLPLPRASKKGGSTANGGSLAGAM